MSPELRLCLALNPSDTVWTIYTQPFTQPWVIFLAKRRKNVLLSKFYTQPFTQPWIIFLAKHCKNVLLS